MFDWGKFVIWVLEKMPWVVCLISAFLAFFPESLTPNIYLPIRQEWGGWFAVLFLLSLAFSVVWCVHKYQVWKHERQRFDHLPSDVRYLLLDLYFGGVGAAKVQVQNPIIAMLCVQGFLVMCNAGMMTAEEKGVMVMVTLSSRSLAYFESHEAEFRKRYQDLQGELKYYGML